MERIRRESFRPSLPAGLKGLLEEPTECYDAAKEKYWLFGNDLRKRIDECKGDLTVQRDLTRKETYTKSSNWQTPQKSLSGSHEQGKRFNYNNRNSNNNKNNGNSKYNNDKRKQQKKR